MGRFGFFALGGQVAVKRVKRVKRGGFFLAGMNIAWVFFCWNCEDGEGEGKGRGNSEREGKGQG